MDPHTAFCPNWACPARGQVGQGTITVHSWTERRYRCQVCRRTFAATMGTPFYRLQTEAALVLVVLNLLSWGLPHPGGGPDLRCGRADRGRLVAASGAALP